MLSCFCTRDSLHLVAPPSHLTPQCPLCQANLTQCISVGFPNQTEPLKGLTGTRKSRRHSGDPSSVSELAQGFCGDSSLSYGIQATYFSKLQYGLNRSTKICIFSSSPKDRYGMIRRRPWSTLGLERTKVLLIWSKSITSWSLSPVRRRLPCRGREDGGPINGVRMVEAAPPSEPSEGALKEPSRHFLGNKQCEFHLINFQISVLALGIVSRDQNVPIQSPLPQENVSYLKFIWPYF